MILVIDPVSIKMAELVDVRDDEGHFMKLKKYDGRYYGQHFVGNVKDHLAAIDSMDVRDDDTFILSYPKSGTHWAFTLASMLRTGETVYRGSPTFLDFTDMETLDNLPSPRVFASHMTFDFMPKQVKEGKGKVIAIFRNPKDVFTSLYTFVKKLDHASLKDTYQTTWESLLTFYVEGRIFYGSWFEYMQSWDEVRREHNGNNIMYLIYEDMIQNLSPHVQKLASFLGVTFGPDFPDKVAEKCTFRNMAEEATRTFTPSDQWENYTNNKTLPIYRKGAVGDWKNYFTVAQNEHFDKVYNDKMKNSTFGFRFE
ncbi:sulfotransferase 1A2-like [Mizuhopecten yessoensis]|uniref:sulfotransferase 1A2-like n=1 Tax=Mizuhopecten yessoensis TaxID=6573 RepID=UPI000B45719A|nr:sulfotransferase 1A2-like [Mizuhopecten yessoensis]